MFSLLSERERQRETERETERGVKRDGEFVAGLQLAGVVTAQFASTGSIDRRAPSFGN